MQALLAIGLTNAIVAVLLGLLVYGLSKLCQRPALLHLLWVLVLLKLVAPPLIPITIQAQLPWAGHSSGAHQSSALAGFALLLWTLGALIYYGFLLRHLFLFRRLLHYSVEAPPWLKEEAQAIAKDLGLSSAPTIWLIPGPVPPMLWNGIRSTRILFPAELIERLTLEEARALIAHELSHLRRRDHLVRWLELLVAGLYWWCPFVWWARRQLHIYEEQSCDAWVVAHWPAKTYANAILKALELLSQRQVTLPVTVSGLGQVELLKRRLTEILRSNPPPRKISCPGWALVAVVFVGIPILPSLMSPPLERPAVTSPKPKMAIAQLTPKQVPRGSKIGMLDARVVFLILMPEGKTLTVTGKEAQWLQEMAPDAQAILIIRGESPSGPSLTCSLEKPLAWGAFASAALAIACSPDGQRFALALDNQVVQIRDARTRALISTLADHQDLVTDLAFSPDGSLLATASADRTVKLWNARTGSLTATLSGHRKWVYALAFSPNGKVLATAGYDRDIFLWDVIAAQQLGVLKGHQSAVRSLTFSPSGSHLASGDGQGNVYLWSMESRGLKHALKGHGGTVRKLQFSRQGHLLGSGSEDGTAILWDWETKKARFRLKHASSVTTLSFSPAGETLVTGSQQGTIRVWSTLTGKPGPTVSGHSDAISGLTFTPDQRVLTAGYDGIIKLWEARVNAQWLLRGTTPGSGAAIPQVPGIYILDQLPVPLVEQKNRD